MLTLQPFGTFAFFLLTLKPFGTFAFFLFTLESLGTFAFFLLTLQAFGTFAFFLLTLLNTLLFQTCKFLLIAIQEISYTKLPIGTNLKIKLDIFQKISNVYIPSFLNMSNIKESIHMMYTTA